MARTKKIEKSGEKKVKRFRRLRWFFKWIVMPIMILVLAAAGFLYYQYSEALDSYNKPKPAPTKTVEPQLDDIKEDHKVDENTYTYVGP
jgi:hypothetical protein